MRALLFFHGKLCFHIWQENNWESCYWLSNIGAREPGRACIYHKKGKGVVKNAQNAIQRRFTFSTFKSLDFNPHVVEYLSS